MQAIEFQAQLIDGVIQLPRAYQRWQEGQGNRMKDLPDFA